MDIGSALRAVRESQNLSRKEFSERLNISERTIANYELGENSPSYDYINKLVTEFGVNSGYFFGKEGMFPEEKPLKDFSDFVGVPLLADVRAAAGAGAFVDNESVERSISFRRDWLKGKGISTSMLSAIHVTGDSMEPTLRNGDILLVDGSQTQPKTDSIYVVYADHGLVVKRCGALKDNILTLVSDNPAIRDMSVDLADGHNHVAGRVVWFGRAI